VETESTAGNSRKCFTWSSRRDGEQGECDEF
jgi:hypothetical protein